MDYLYILYFLVFILFIIMNYFIFLYPPKTFKTPTTKKSVTWKL